ncbi:hypothetical protein BKA64DRAFT_660072 [Cadophora sp. MPI-SDFR-AT-0126]|nr:hypothetical protein BKA64DRAFT_660072 [Leotiomycetes sp. MPI-SDFR-AT-0126]
MRFLSQEVAWLWTLHRLASPRLASPPPANANNTRYSCPCIRKHQGTFLSIMIDDLVYHNILRYALYRTWAAAQA